MALGPRHILAAQQFAPGFLRHIFERADWFNARLDEDPRMLRHWLEDFFYVILFYEPSTRTRGSFEMALKRLGANGVETENAKEFSSAAKGEKTRHTMRVFCGYRPDVIICRHYEEGALHIAAETADQYFKQTRRRVSVVNAGDGPGQHPTQAALDCYTIERHFGAAEGLTILIGGDLLCGRTTHSLAYLLAKFPGNRFIFVAPEMLRMKQDIKDYLARHGVQFWETTNLASVIREADVVYWTRVQKEKLEKIFLQMHEDPSVAKAKASEFYESIRGQYQIGLPEVEMMRDKAILMHPLPIDGAVEEIKDEVEDHPKAKYFEQSDNGLPVRMALLEWLLRGDQHC